MNQSSSKDQKRIALVTDIFKIGGGLTHIRQITNEIKDFQFGVFARGGTQVDLFSGLKNVQIFDKGYTPHNIMAFNPDLIHIHHLKPLVKFYQNPFRKYHIPILFTAHGLHIRKYDFLRGVKNKLKKWLRFNLERYLFTRVNQLICVSKEDMNFIEQQYRIKNVKFISNGLDFDKIEETPYPQKSELRKNLDLPQKSTLFLTIARFDFAKGYDVLLDAILLLKDYLRQRPVNFLFVGDGPEQAKIQQIVSSNNMTEYITFLGEVYPTEKLLISCDAFILPSRWEGLPISLIEAGHFKLPVIAADTFGVREIIENNISGLLFQIENAVKLAELIQKFLQNEYDWEDMTQQLHQSVHQNFNLLTNMNYLKSLYLKMLPIQ